MGESPIVINPWAYSAIIAGTWIYNSDDAAYRQGIMYSQTTTDNDQIDFLIDLPADGTYTFTHIGYQGTNTPIVKWYIDGNLFQTNDTYGVITYNKKYSTAGLSWTKGLHTLSTKIDGKNAASLGRVYYVIRPEIIRTA